MRAVRVARAFRGAGASRSASSSGSRWRARDGDDDAAKRDDASDDDAFEAMMAMDDAYGSGVLNEEKSGRPRESAAEKAKRVARELAKRGVLVGDRVRVDVRVGAPLPARSKKFASDSTAAAADAGASTTTTTTSTTDSTATKRRFITRAVHGYVVCVRNGRAGVKRTGHGDTETSCPTYPTAWCTALDVGELWEMCTGPRNLAGVSGASDEALAEYLKATGQSSDGEEEEARS